jgi:hypothetical protein
MSTTSTGRAPARHWPLLLIGAPAAVAIWSGWVGLGGLAGFGPVHPLPGIFPHAVINTAITLPVGVEAYGAYALGTWLTPGTPKRAVTFARRSAIGALLLGMAGQVAYHLLAAARATAAPWGVTILVSCMPVVTLGFAGALTHLRRAGDPGAERAGDATGQVVPAVARAQAIPEAMAPAIGTPPERAIQGAISGTPREATGKPEATPDAKPSSEPPSVPQAKPPARPREAAGISREPDAIKARSAYRRSVQTGKPLSDRVLGGMFERGRTWGANRIKECEDGPALATSSPQAREG